MEMDSSIDPARIAMHADWIAAMIEHAQQVQSSTDDCDTIESIALLCRYQ